MKKQNDRWAYSVLLCAVLAFPGHAEDEPASDAAETRKLGTVIVTAQRREEQLFDVPLSVTALDETALTDAGVLSTRDLTLVTPGLNAATQGFAFQPSIRGVSSTSTVLGDETNVAIYIDNVYSPFQIGNSLNLGAVERIEVLKGPQGTLFGRNATGGAIRVVTEKPSFEPVARGSVDYGFDLESLETSVYASTGLTDKIAASLTLYGYEDAGYVRNLTPGQGDVADTNQFTARGKLLWQVSDDVDLTLGLNTTNYNSSAAFATAVQDGVLSFRNVQGAIVTDPDSNPYTVALNFNPYVKTLASGGYAQFDWRFASHNLRSTSSYNEYKVKAFLDSDRTNIDLTRFYIFSDTQVLTQEFELTSSFDHPINYVAGIFYYDSAAESPGNEAYSRPLSPAVGGVRVPTGPQFLAARTAGNVDAVSSAVFGEIYYDVSEQLRLIGGYRFTTEEKDAVAINALSGARVAATDSWDNSSWRGTVQYRFNPDNNIYFTHSTGFKSGLFNAGALTNPLQRAEPEEVTAFEAGLRSRIGPVTIMAAAFQYDFDNIQLQVNNILNPVAGSTILQNAATAEIRGAELDLGAYLTDSWRVQLGVSWLPTAEYTTFTGGLDFVPNAGGLGATPVAVDLSGSRIIRSPEMTVSLTSTYETEIAGGSLKASGTFFHSDEFLWIPGGAVTQDSYAILNGRIAWTTPDDRFTYSVWGRNLGDETYWLQAGANSGGFSGSYAQPQVIGVGISASF